jgi:hypothetical protein
LQQTAAHRAFAGLELETSLAATSRLRLEGTLAITDGKYTEFNSVYIEQVYRKS